VTVSSEEPQSSRPLLTADLDRRLTFADVPPRVGSQSQVWMCYDGYAKRDVALKVGFEGVDLAQEADAARISDSRVGTLYGFGTLPDGEQYVEMEWISMPTLQQQLDTGAFGEDWTLAVRVAGEAALALKAAHELSVCHWDLSPTNMFVQLRPNISVKLIDFGLANYDKRGFGTYQYMAPESFVDGLWRGPAADIYSLGCILYQMLFGTYPYAPATSDKLRACHCSADPVPIPVRDLPPTLVQVLRKMLAKDPKHRYQSASELEELLPKLAEAPRWPGVSASTVFGIALVAGAVPIGISMATRHATEYANELNWSVNYLFIVPAAWGSAIACLEDADIIAVHSLSRGDFWSEWKSFRRVFSWLAGFVLVMGVATSVVGHLRRPPGSTPEWQQAWALMLPASVLEGLHIAAFILFCTFSAWAPRILGFGRLSDESAHRLRSLRIRLGLVASIFATTAWLAWVQEGAGKRRWLEYFVGDLSKGIWAWLSETPTVGPWGGPLVLGAWFLFVTLVAGSHALKTSRIDWGHCVLILLAFVGVVAFVFVRLGLLCAVLAAIAWELLNRNAANEGKMVADRSRRVDS